MLCKFCKNEVKDTGRISFDCTFCPGEVSFRSYFGDIDIAFLRYKHLEVRLLLKDDRTIIVDTRKTFFDENYIVLRVFKLLDINPQNLQEKLSMYLLFM